MKTFKWTVPELPLTKAERFIRISKGEFGHGSYARAFVVYLLLTMLAGILISASATLVIYITEWLIIPVAIVIYYFAFYWAVKSQVVDRIKTEQVGTSKAHPADVRG
ncbi:MAG: hypothetical protein AAFY98_04870 [Verrucomicrobiota bacterium]